MTDNEIALGWLHSPPRLPPSDNPFDAAFPQVMWVKESLSKLVTKWEVPAFEAELVFQSWVKAHRNLRKLRVTNRRRATEEKEMQAAITTSFFGEEEKEAQPTSERLKFLAEEVRLLEERGYKVPIKWVVKELSNPWKEDQRPYLRWIISRWIVPEENMPPLCLCSDPLILEIAKRKNDSRMNIDRTSTADALKHLIRYHELYRPKEGRRFRKWWIQRELGDEK